MNINRLLRLARNGAPVGAVRIRHDSFMVMKWLRSGTSYLTNRTR